MTLGDDRWGIGRLQLGRVNAVKDLGFTERQARFLLTVMQHSGVFVERQYCSFAGITHGQKTHDFIHRLVQHGFTRAIRPGALHRGRLYHVHHKRLYAAIAQTDNRNRRKSPLGRMVERLMLLDAVLDDRNHTWLGTEGDKWRYFVLRLDDSRLQKEELPHLLFGKGARRVLRLFPEKLPIGVELDGHQHVFLYLAKGPNRGHSKPKATAFSFRRSDATASANSGICAPWESRNRFLVRTSRSDQLIRNQRRRSR